MHSWAWLWEHRRVFVSWGFHASKDPFRLDTPAGQRDGQRFARQIEELLSSTATVHLRGLHYRIVAVAKVKKPNGEIYVNTDADWVWLVDHASKAARWLGYVPFERIVDAAKERREACQQMARDDGARADRDRRAGGVAATDIAADCPRGGNAVLRFRARRAGAASRAALATAGRGAIIRASCLSPRCRPDQMGSRRGKDRYAQLLTARGKAVKGLRIGLPPVEAVEPEIDEPSPEPLFTTEDDFTDASQKLVAYKKLDGEMG